MIDGMLGRVKKTACISCVCDKFDSMQKLKFLFLVALALCLAGCPYLSTVPIDDPNIEVDPQLLGTWYLMVGNGGADDYVVAQKDEFVYEIKTTVPPPPDSEDDPSDVIYNAHFSQIGSKTFLNLQRRSQGEGYYFFSFEKDAQHLYLKEITSNIKERFKCSEEWRAFVKKYMNLSFFYGEELVFAKR